MDDDKFTHWWNELMATAEKYNTSVTKRQITAYRARYEAGDSPLDALIWMDKLHEKS